MLAVRQFSQLLERRGPIRVSRRRKRRKKRLVRVRLTKAGVCLPRAAPDSSPSCLRLCGVKVIGEKPNRAGLRSRLRLSSHLWRSRSQPGSENIRATGAPPQISLCNNREIRQFTCTHTIFADIGIDDLWNHFQVCYVFFLYFSSPKKVFLLLFF